MVDALEQVSTIKEPLQTTDMEEVLAVSGMHIRLPIALAPMQAWVMLPVIVTILSALGFPETKGKDLFYLLE